MQLQQDALSKFRKVFYFIRGNFVTVQTETLILDQYTANPSYRIGLNVQERIITPDLDDTLNDNSQGYNNYAAPGSR